ncbi:hypothetical protein LOTGIDRAFT_161474 [Lottia gigantea]|uniref:Uncharacterized protein n=1 Tax=Lottia gigantea TaxID=225164 RepID=V4BYP1_LOTGI|nr:hypothetical protein LOTGIDRAFT_161474 [Lottia gigantea]ESO94259.1 hypothetical protein LOTGIDRAFT_161474 [Lottia gigantea]
MVCTISAILSTSHPLCNIALTIDEVHSMKNAVKPEESFLNKLQQKTEKSTDLLKSLVRDIRFLSLKPNLNQDPKVETKLKDWTPELKEEMARSETQDGCQVVIQKELVDDVRTRVCKMLTRAGIDVSTIDDQQLQDFVDHLQNEMGGKKASDVFGSDVNHYQFLETSKMMPRNEEEMAKIRKYLDEGCGDSIVISHQIHRQTMTVPESRLSPMLLELVPPSIRRTDDVGSIYKAVIDNPKTWLSLQQH